MLLSCDLTNTYTGCKKNLKRIDEATLERVQQLWPSAVRLHLSQWTEIDRCHVVAFVLYCSSIAIGIWQIAPKSDCLKWILWLSFIWIFWCLLLTMFCIWSRLKFLLLASLILGYLSSRAESAAGGLQKRSYTSTISVLVNLLDTYSDSGLIRMKTVKVMLSFINSRQTKSHKRNNFFDHY